MKNKLFIFGAVIMGLFVLHSTTDVYSYPWFARRLVDNCNKCHVSFPKTNDYGWYVKTTGYELPEISYEGLEESPVKRFFRYFPVAARFEVDVINSQPSDIKGDLTFREIQLISGGSIFDNNISWWFHKHMVEDNTAVSLFDGTPHEMWAQYNYKFGKYNVNRINLRYGMSELPLRFSPSKTNIIENGYAIYNAVLGENSFTLSTPQYGIYLNATKLGGENFNEVKSNLSLGFVNGIGDFTSNKFNQVFGRISTTVSNVMIGAYTYVGSRDIAMAMDEHGDEHTEEAEVGHGDEHAEALMTTGNNFYRLGLDFDANVTPSINIFALALYGRDSNPLGLERSVSGNYYGGFIGADYSPNERLLLSARFDLVRFGNLPAEEHSEHGEEMAMEEDVHGAEGGEHSGGAHAHGALLTSNTDTMVLGVNFLPIPAIYQVRMTAEYRFGFRGRSDLIIAGLQFAL